MSNKKYGVLYVGVTSDLVKRVYQHKSKLIEGFTSRYSIDKLVYYEYCNDVKSAIQREKNIKKYLRQWKIDLIEKANPEWNDLYSEIVT